MINKLLPMDVAVQKYVKDRSMLLLGGSPQSRFPVSFCKEILRQKRQGSLAVNDLLLTTPGINFGGDLLVAAGLVDSVIANYAGHGRSGLSATVRNALEKGIPRKLKWEDESNFTHVPRIMAGALNVPFMPTNSGLWGDLRKPGLWDGKYPYRKNLVFEDPYGSGKKVSLVQALNPDVTVVHVPFADSHGNGSILGALFYDFWVGRCGKNIILVADHIVDIAMHKQFPNLVTVPGVFVSAVIPWYMSAWPNNSPGIYGEDLEHMKLHVKESKKQESMNAFMEKYVYSWQNHNEFIKLIGDETVKSLQNNPTRWLAEPFQQWIYPQGKVEELLQDARSKQ